jgi:hypothetical protein
LDLLDYAAKFELFSKVSIWLDKAGSSWRPLVVRFRAHLSTKKTKTKKMRKKAELEKSSVFILPTSI